ncbi:membrane-associated proteins in eicosanoid and glutathione metabolism [Rhizodiscina lignyota]|uniref:Membrane-associated proteins in eicosanoid and glutathione metabolism n=1 Tax=Rhizodiscina lignyota TaxID=1504668 RepID=A0A9P4MCY5_9PEZI|nr:membrane-associated proteins in eicosanoid and glutathione metabolism [Rhizodiscina lignyota]
MSLSITLPKEYGYVLLTATATFFVSTWHGMRVAPFRKAAKMPYPNAYATTSDIDKADSEERKKAMYLFNCAQRAHANFMENYNSTLPAILIAGLKFPLTSAAVGAVWTVCRVLYARGYTRADKEQGKGRYAGMAFWLCQAVLYGMTGWMGVQMFM